MSLQDLTPNSRVPNPHDGFVDFEQGAEIARCRCDHGEPEGSGLAFR